MEQQRTSSMTTTTPPGCLGVILSWFEGGRGYNYITSPNDPDSSTVEVGNDIVHVGVRPSEFRTTPHPLKILSRIAFAMTALGCAMAACGYLVFSSHEPTVSTVSPTPISSPVGEMPSSGPNWAHVEIPKPSPTPSSGLQMQIVP